jgi:hypothetical protein
MITIARKPFDPSKLAFPSDRLTVAEIRCVNPAIDVEQYPSLDATSLSAMLRTERRYARAAYERMLGTSATTILEEHDCLKKLMLSYCLHGLADSLEGAGQLAESIPRQVEAQTRRPG